MAGNFCLEKIFTPCSHRWNFYTMNFLSCVNDYTEPMVTFTTWTKIYSTEFFKGSLVGWNFCPAKFIWYFYAWAILPFIIIPAITLWDYHRASNKICPLFLHGKTKGGGMDLILYSGKLSREKTCGSVYKCDHFAEKTFVGGSKTEKFVNVFSLKSFPLYGIWHEWWPYAVYGNRMRMWMKCWIL